jgi:hypothetical protein
VNFLLPTSTRNNGPQDTIFFRIPVASTTFLDTLSLLSFVVA